MYTLYALLVDARVIAADTSFYEQLLYRRSSSMSERPVLSDRSCFCCPRGTHVGLMC